jgi:hypothetical protein
VLVEIVDGSYARYILIYGSFLSSMAIVSRGS